MKLTHLVIAVVTCLFCACADEPATPHFRLKISVFNEQGNFEYLLTDTSFRLDNVPTTAERRGINPIVNIRISDNDSLKLVSLLNAKSYDCELQHALLVSKIEFTNDSGTVVVDPNVNHPKELDYAVRVINALVPAEFRLEFIDMQPAIEPDGKLRI